VASQQSANISGYTAAEQMKKKKRKNWIKNSLVRAFSRRKSKTDSLSAGEPDTLSLRSELSGVEPSTSVAVTAGEMSQETASRHSASELVFDEHGAQDLSSLVDDLQDRLRETEGLLTEMRLDSLASFQHAEQQQETIARLELEVSALKSENKALHRLLAQQVGVTSVSKQSGSPDSSIHSDCSSYNSASDSAFSSRLSAVEPLGSSYGAVKSAYKSTDLRQRFSLCDTVGSDADDTTLTSSLHRVIIMMTTSLDRSTILTSLDHSAMTAGLDRSVDPDRSTDATLTLDVLDADDSTSQPSRDDGQSAGRSLCVGHVMLADNTSWAMLDEMCGDVFKEYIHRWDKDLGLGLTVDSLCSYHLGDITRTLGSTEDPSVRPVDCLSSSGQPSYPSSTLTLHLKRWQEDSVDSLVFATLVPPVIVQQCLRDLHDTKCLVLHGAKMTGKHHVARCLAQHLVLSRHGRLSSDFLLEFTRHDNKELYVKELAVFLYGACHLHKEKSVTPRPCVIIIDSLHHADSLDVALRDVLTLDFDIRPFVIGICETTHKQAPQLSLQPQLSLLSDSTLRCATFTVDTESTHKFLARFLVRRLVDAELRCFDVVRRDEDCGVLLSSAVVEWLLQIWQRVGCLVAVLSNTPDVCLGPGVFMICPMYMDKARTWFDNTWNHSIHPYLTQLIHDSVFCMVLESRQSIKAQCEELCDWLCRTYPWNKKFGELTNLARLNCGDLDRTSLTTSGTRSSVMKTSSPSLVRPFPSMTSKHRGASVAFRETVEMCSDNDNTPTPSGDVSRRLLINV